MLLWGIEHASQAGGKLLGGRPMRLLLLLLLVLLLHGSYGIGTVDG